MLRWLFSSNRLTPFAGGLLGVLGLYAALKLLPRTIAYAIRRWLFGLVTELAFVILAGLLTEALVDRIMPRNGTSRDAPLTK